jgi:hypothetical protein
VTTATATALRLHRSLSEPLAARRIVVAVRSYRIELRPEGADVLAAAGARARAAAELLAGEGVPVRWVRAVYAPEDGSCFLVLEGGSPAAVAEAGRRAGLDVVRIEESPTEEGMSR